MGFTRFVIMTYSVEEKRWEGEQKKSADIICVQPKAKRRSDIAKRQDCLAALSVR